MQFHGKVGPPRLHYDLKREKKKVVGLVTMEGLISPNKKKARQNGDRWGPRHEWQTTTKVEGERGGQDRKFQWEYPSYLRTHFANGVEPGQMGGGNLNGGNPTSGKCAEANPSRPRGSSLVPFPSGRKKDGSNGKT